ncbi:hypothetical protein [Natrarchaeobius oligotrophus]|uniref:hypothetical protein n=1 Tax=Natrarchaeobius oligotrophus TaxID=3455743 RepID=UPI001FB46FB3|nr:hypothetical protein [Natrarchaeobius chitinivorans]
MSGEDERASDGAGEADVSDVADRDVGSGSDPVDGDGRASNAADGGASSAAERPGDSATVDDGRGTARLESRLAAVRTNPRVRRPAFALAAVVGLGLAWVHWLGLVCGGALVGLLSPSLRRGVVAALGFGVLVLVVFFLRIGPVALVIEMRPIVFVTVASAFALPALGALLRGVL